MDPSTAPMIHMTARIGEVIVDVHPLVVGNDRDDLHLHVRSTGDARRRFRSAKRHHPPAVRLADPSLRSISARLADRHRAERAGYGEPPNAASMRTGEARPGEPLD
jgi:hypothetical protein